MYNKKASEIIQHGLAHGESYDIINDRLKLAGVDFHLEKSRPQGWTEQEMKEGFIPATEEAKPVLTLSDLMGRNVKLAGKTVDFWCKEGHYEVTYNESGCAVKAVRINV